MSEDFSLKPGKMHNTFNLNEFLLLIFASAKNIAIHCRALLEMFRGRVFLSLCPETELDSYP